MKHVSAGIFSLAMLVSFQILAAPLGLPEVPIPKNNTQTAEKIALGQKLFHDKRFSSTGDVSCATCHEAKKAFTDRLRVSEGIKKKTGTRNAPTVINSAYFTSFFWDGREPSLEAQSTQPFLNPVEMNLENHDPILKIVRTDPEYGKAFKTVFGKSGNKVTMQEVSMAIASFERTLVSGDSPFDKYWFKGDKKALTPSQKRGFNVFLGQGRCVSCHTIEQDHAIFTDNRFHNLGIGFKRIRDNVTRTAQEFLKSKREGMNVDIEVLTAENASELGRFAVTEDVTHIGAFKTSTLRNIELTAPYMHDGSLKELEDVVDFYDNGGRLKDTDPVDDFQSGGIRPLDLSKRQKADLVDFMKALTSPGALGLMKN